MFQSRSIMVGNLQMGGKSPVSIQSMANTETNNIEASVAQCIKIFDAGADLVRLATQNQKQVVSLGIIREKLNSLGYTGPLAADVHFLPKVALETAKLVEKVRINPGNYINKKYIGPDKYSVFEQKKQIAIIRENLLPLISTCKEYNTAIRIGVNHGSLSERMLKWFGNSPEGMVESAMEFIHIFHNEDFNDLVISLKASHSQAMIYANRLLAKRMQKEGMNYPIHLGVTEAGDQEDGRVKSANGIGGLLADGIGDTIRVSLTEAPEEEIPVARKIVDLFGDRKHSPGFLQKSSSFFHPYEYKKRLSLPTEKTGGKNHPIVISGSGKEDLSKAAIPETGYHLDNENKLVKGEQGSEFVFINNMLAHEPANTGINLITDFKSWKDNYQKKKNYYPLFNWKDYGKNINETYGLHFIEVDDIETPSKFFEILDNELFGIIILNLKQKNSIQNSRKFFEMLGQINNLMPVIFHKKYSSANKDELIIKASTEIGSLLNDGFGDGIWIEDENQDFTNSELRELSFSILQATGRRISKTEYISCPSCGRTLFNIQETLQKVKKATKEFSSLKIAVMGCIVNGLGEMADADYGYVGAGPGLISLFKGKEAVKKNIPEEKAVEEMVKIIRDNL